MQKLANVCRIVGCSENKLRSPIIPRADVTDIGLSRDQNLCRTKITKFQNTSCWVEQQILGFDISMANTNRVDIGKGTEKLVHIQLDLQHRHWLFEFGVMATSAVDSFRHIFQHEIQVNFIFLGNEVGS